MELKLQEVSKIVIEGFVQVIRGDDMKIQKELIINKSVKSFDEVFKVKSMLKDEFAKFHNVTSQNIDYATENNKVDYVKIGTVIVILMTETTRTYSPNKSKKRIGTFGGNAERI